MFTMIAIVLPTMLGYNLVFGKGKILHFGPLGVSLVAAYATFATFHATHLYVLSICAGILGTVMISSLFAWLSFRLDGDALGILTIAVHLAILTLVLNWTPITGGTRGLTAIPRMWFMDSPGIFFLCATALAVFWIALFWFLDRCAFGRQLHALAEHEWHASAQGINRRRVHHLAFLISGLASLTTNILYPQYVHLLHPSDFMFPALIFMVMVVVAGKPGSVVGVVLSAGLLSFLREGLRFVRIAPDVLGPARLILFGGILFLAVWVRRDVLFPKRRSV